MECGGAPPLWTYRGWKKSSGCSGNLCKSGSRCDCTHDILSNAFDPRNPRLICVALKFEIVPAPELSLAEQAEVFASAFTGYVGGSFQMNATTLASFLTAQGIDLCYSRFARNDQGELVSFGYINRTGNISRLAGMGTVGTARRSGAAAFVLSSLLEEAKARGDQAMVLEVIEQNPAAVKLYESHGFRSLGRLLGWRHKPGEAPIQNGDLRELSVLEASRWPTTPDYPDLPWQVSRHAATKVASARAFALDDVAVVTGDPGTIPTRLHSFLGLNEDTGESMRELLRQLLARFPEAEFYAPPIFPERFGQEIFQPLGFDQEKLSQFLMRKDL